MSQSSNSRRMVVLTEGHSNPITAKTAASLLRYCPEQVVAVYDSATSSKTAQELFGVGGETPVISDLGQANANMLTIGIAPSGGKLPTAWRAVLLDAIGRNMDVLSGMHQFLADDEQISAAAKQHGVRLIDVRKNDEKDVADAEGLNENCLRIHTVGNDCCVGKMVASIELTKGLSSRGIDAKFVATGQTGIMIEGDGCPVDCVVSDFVNGAAEKLVKSNQHHEAMVIEGQGSLTHPRYSAVTLGLLHGCAPHGIILCYEAGRTHHHHMESIPLPSIQEMKEIVETMANARHPARVIGIAMNSRRLSEAEALAEQEKVRAQFGIPVVDVIRHGSDELVDAILKLKSSSE